jgi:hypothetical protein
VNIRLDSDKKRVNLFFIQDDGTIGSFSYVFSYKGNIDLKTYLNVYYTEDGYKLFE